MGAQNPSRQGLSTAGRVGLPPGARSRDDHGVAGQGERAPRRVRVEPWRELAEAQAGVVSRTQLLDLGMSSGAIASRLRSGRWSRLLPGVYLTWTGPRSDLTSVWAAVLYAGGASAAGGLTALWLWGVVPVAPDVVTVCVPSSRRVTGQPGLRVAIRRGWDPAVHPAALPPRLRVEEALLDAVAAVDDEARCVDLVLRAVNRRHTTAARVLGALAQRRRMRWRRLVEELLTDVDDGVRSTLELRWARDVERRHRLPRGERNAADVDAAGRRRYRDVRLRRWGVVVELDGREAHPDGAVFRDRARDNAVVERGEVPLRYGWREVASDPCGVAAQVVRVLRANGWTGTARPCRPGCPAAGNGSA